MIFEKITLIIRVLMILKIENVLIKEQSEMISYDIQPKQSWVRKIQQLYTLPHQMLEWNCWEIRLNLISTGIGNLVSCKCRECGLEEDIMDFEEIG